METTIGQDVMQEPVFIVCTARSGSTLLRYILDTHEWIDAPQELHLGPLAEDMVRTVSRLVPATAMDKATHEKQVLGEVRGHLESLIRTHLKKKIWCDKSVSTIEHLPLLMKVFPQARYIFLHRHCLDFVYSAMEVSKYGYEGFWFEDFVLQHPENLVDAFVNFWCIQTEKRLVLEADQEFLIFSIKYEDIVSRTVPTIQELFQFLNLPFEEKLLDHVFSKERLGHGDLKIQATHRIEPNTGKGRLIPIKYIKTETLNRMNALLERLGYETVTGTWNFEKMHSNRESQDIHVQGINAIHKHLNERMKRAVPPDLQREVLQVKVVGLDAPWILDFSEHRCDSTMNSTKSITMEITIHFETLWALIEKDLNISIALRNGEISTNGDYHLFHRIGNYLFG